jgi:hypothetical protein
VRGAGVGRGRLGSGARGAHEEREQEGAARHQNSGRSERTASIENASSKGKGPDVAARPLRSRHAIEWMPLSSAAAFRSSACTACAPWSSPRRRGS